MKRLLSPLLTSVLAVAIASQASAKPFSGPYAGAQAAWTHTKVGNPSTDAGKPNLGRSQDAVQGGVFVGYNYKPTEKIVLSAEGGFNMGVEDAIRRVSSGSAATINPRYSFDLGARAGYLIDDKTLAYVRGGYENLRASVRIANGANVSYARENFDGWSAGGGVERAITDWLTVRAEYRFSDFRNGGTFERHQALVGAAYHF